MTKSKQQLSKELGETVGRPILKRISLDKSILVLSTILIAVIAIAMSVILTLYSYVNRLEKSATYEYVINLENELKASELRAYFYQYKYVKYYTQIVSIMGNEFANDSATYTRYREAFNNIQIEARKHGIPDTTDISANWVFKPYNSTPAANASTPAASTAAVSTPAASTKTDKK